MDGYHKRHSRGYFRPNAGRNLDRVFELFQPCHHVIKLWRRETKKKVVTGVERFWKVLDFGQAGDNVGCLLRGTDRDEVERGQVLAKPGSIHPHKKFKCEVHVLTKEEGGRHTPFFSNHRPQFYFRTTDVTRSVKLPEGTEMVMLALRVVRDRSPWSRERLTTTPRAARPRGFRSPWPGLCRSWMRRWSEPPADCQAGVSF